MKKTLLLLIITALYLSCNLADNIDSDNEPDEKSCGEMFVDTRDNQSYPTIEIGNQCWMTKNINYGNFTNSNFTNTAHSDVSNNGIIEKYALDNDPLNNELYGGIYDWKELMNYNFTPGSQGICPEGWHVPTDEEWRELEETVGGTLEAGKALKSGGTSGFNILLAGSRTAKGAFAGLSQTSLWTSTPSASHPDSRANNRNFIEGADNIQRNTDVMVTGKYCRCIRDE